MKNIHVIPTDKPSRLRYNLSNVLALTKEPYRDYSKQVNQHIYITSDEEIKEGDYFIGFAVTDKKPYISCASEYKARKKEKGKIILTTDVYLIIDGVQEIKDEFLEWFVKNPTCEYVEVNQIEQIPDGITFGMFGNDEPPTELIYKIIIPQEEWLSPMQSFKVKEEHKRGYVSETEFLGVQFILKDGSKQFIPIQDSLIEKMKPLQEQWQKDMDKSLQEPKQETTLEEAAERIYPGIDRQVDRMLFIKGAQWQQEQDKKLYSDEEMKSAFFNGGDMKDIEEFNYWFEQFKKK
jgi:hypothetical protein